ncbi:hypothetical protein LX64_04981 [Chitinophaga skermanii]|uniref:Wadjet protein JetD C-terminal domain-containing protein n=1 Tax=Chitinophaga skermanii TaxID=331697 RepID=A0A327PZW0_9BACT|nr:Wadjet anti-phage system protein JetD domain-containing protein [Chitinophaga skermanii]RAI97678.1 hypothetical protein LX64_04981 [Chitinophaga skermanii]
MITLQELLVKSDKHFFRIAGAILKNENPFPLVIPSDKKVKDTGFNQLQLAIVPLYNHSKEAKGKGYTVIWKTKNIQGSPQKIPDKIFFESLEDYLFFTKREKVFLKIKETFKLITDSFPNNSQWVAEQPAFLLTYAGIMSDLLKVVRYFFDHSPPHPFYLRELPIALHTKFIEQNTKPLKKMLDNILPSYKINITEKDFSGRYQIKRNNIYTQVRVLDEVLKSTLGYHEVALTIDDAALLPWKPDKVFIIENGACFRSFPKIKNSVAIFGEGFKSRVNKHIPWLANCELYCWFDMDAAGFEMLNMTRNYYHHAMSFLMDETTYNEFSSFSVHSKYRKIELPHLHPYEQKMYAFLQKENRRLEQEHITNRYVQEQLMAKCISLSE